MCRISPHVILGYPPSSRSVVCLKIFYFNQLKPREVAAWRPLNYYPSKVRVWLLSSHKTLHSNAFSLMAKKEYSMLFL